jgi:hypothetical protein
VIARLRDDPQIWELLQELTRKSRSFPIRYQGVEAAERRRPAKGLYEYLHLGTLTQTANAVGAVIGLMDII